jgi:HAD superfamily hydrolase (TIGR01509 family)
MRQRITAVGFDMDHTLGIDNKLERVAFLRLLEMLLDEGGHTLGTLTDEIDHIDALLALQRSGACTIDEAVARFVLERGLPPKDAYAERFRDMALAMVDELVVPLPGARATLTRLRERGIAVAVLSNGWNPLQDRKVRRVGFDGPVIASGDIGAQKPSPQAFAALLAALGTPADETMYVGDDPHGDVAGARDAGLQAVWIDADRRAYPPDLPAPPYTIASLEELLALIPAQSVTLK